MLGKKKCQNQRQRAQCKDCGGGAIFQHQRQRSYCKDCEGSAICQHKRQRSMCKDCDPKGHLADVVRSRVRQAFQSDKELSSKDYLGFKNHIEFQFKEGISWDHRVPLRYKLDGKTPTLEEVAQRLHYTNTQPLWASENIAKGNRYVS